MGGEGEERRRVRRGKDGVGRLESVKKRREGGGEGRERGLRGRGKKGRERREGRERGERG